MHTNASVGADVSSVTPVSSGTVSNLFRSGWTSSIKLSVSYDSRDDRMFPKRGQFHSLSVEFADPLIASESVYTRVAGNGNQGQYD